MTRSLAPLALVALLAGCTGVDLNNPFGGGYGPPQPPPRMDSIFFHAVGQEPGWTLDIGPREMRFSGPYGDGPISQPTPRAINGFAGEIYQTPRLNVNVVHGQCRDGMSGRAWLDKVQLRADNRSFEGCGGPTDMASPPVTASGPLADSHWRVVSVNGRSTPRVGDYRMDFTGNRVSARFGCNSFSGTYQLGRDMVSTGPLMSTKMACMGEAGSFESQGSAVLGLPARVRFEPGRLSLTNNAGIVELERR
jgi:heat shock protein HslJ